MSLVSTTHVSQWNDKSGNAFHAVQGTDANRPIVTANGIKSGRNSLDFAVAYMVTVAGAANTKPFSVFAAVKLTADATYRAVGMY